MRKILWLIPPLLGVAFYAAGSMTGSREVSSARGADRVEDRAGMLGDRMVPAGASAEEMRQALEDRAKAERTRIGSCDAEELKAMLLQVMDRFSHTAEDATERNDLWLFMNDAATRLGKLEQGAAWPWLLEHVPEAREEFMSGWAGVDPAGAFEAVVHSGVKKPCSEETLQALLQGLAGQGPARLREACLRVPWALFLYSPDSSSPPNIGISSESDVRPWIDSGVLPELQRRGVNCRQILSAWGQQYPREVLAQWRAGNELIEPDLLKNLLVPRPFGDLGQEQAIATALSELSEEDRDRLLREVGLSPEEVDYRFVRARYFDPDRQQKFFPPPGQ